MPNTCEWPIVELKLNKKYVYFLLSKAAMATITSNETALPSVTLVQQTNFDGKMHDIYVGSEDKSQDIDGLELSDAAKALCVSIDELWSRIRNGALLARTVRGKVFVYTDLHRDDDDSPPPPPRFYESMIGTNHKETPSFTTAASPETRITVSALELPSVVEVSGNQELALLIDHLSLAKEENREILKLTQDSMARLTQMTDSILEMKDSIIAAKEEQLAIMKDRLAEQAAELSQALKEKENLETLARAIQL